LQRMCKIAHMGAGPLDDLAVGVDQSVGLACKRRDLLREAALEPLRGAGADRRKTRGNAFQRCKAEAHLEHSREQERSREHPKGDDQRTIEGLSLVLDLLRVARDGHEVTALVAEVDGAFDDTQALVLGARDITLAGTVQPDWHVKIFEMRQPTVP